MRIVSHERPRLRWFAMHLCKFVTVHCFKTEAIVLFSIVSLQPGGGGGGGGRGHLTHVQV